MTRKPIQSEEQLETGLVRRLSEMGWKPVTLPDEAALWQNLRTELGAQNGMVFSDGEFAQIRNHLSKGTVFERAHTLRERFTLKRDDGSSDYVRFFDSDAWCKNRYQVTRQICLTGKKDVRTDVTLLVNGLPLCHIELKRRGEALVKAFNQINRYHKVAFSQAASGLFRFVQIFIVSSGVNTRYMANNSRQTFKHTFPWADAENNPINGLDAFADIFLEPCHLSKMIARYVVLNETDRVPMVLRPYQYHAAEKLLEAVERRTGNGYIWHTTGSGKTLTSFKAAQNIAKIPKVEKVVFVVDRKDLDFQTIREFESYQKDSVAHTGSTRALVKAITQAYDPADSAQDNVQDKRKPVLTTIQKLNGALGSNGKALEEFSNRRIVFIFDECHRSQFGETHKRIRAAFPHAQLFGFTGTPIFKDNAIGQRTTADLFGRQLHRYIITNAINDQNVLPFVMETIGSNSAAGLPQGAAEKAPGISPMRPALDLLHHPDRKRSIVDWVIKNHDKKTYQRRYGAMFAVSSVNDLLEYWSLFEESRKAGSHNLRVATIFTYAVNGGEPEADGLIGEENLPEGIDDDTVDLAKRDALERCVEHYNATFGTVQNVNGGPGFYAYYQDISKRMKSRDKDGFVPEQGIDILLVVNMFLTGFDVRSLNTLYVDKNLRYHGLVQAFSRTNRIFDTIKDAGQVVCFRDLRAAADEAIALFADKDAIETVFRADYFKHLAAMNMCIQDLLAITPTPQDVDALMGEDEQGAFVRAFRDVLRYHNRLSMFSEFDPKHLDIDQQTLMDFKSKYLDLAIRSSMSQDEDDREGLRDIDFELEWLSTVKINVPYIINLLVLLKGKAPGTVATQEEKKRILRIIASDPNMQNKRDIIETFISKKLDDIANPDGVESAFWDFWNERRAVAFDSLCLEHNLSSERLRSIINNCVYTGRPPQDIEVRTAFMSQGSILSLMERTADAMKGIISFVETFDMESDQ